MILLKLIWNSIYWDINFISFPPNVLDRIKNVIPILTLEIVIIFILNMDDEFVTSLFG